MLFGNRTRACSSNDPCASVLYVSTAEFCALFVAIIARHVLKYMGVEIYGVCRTGQLSQVIYLHNLQFKQGVPPNTIHDWRDDSPVGPISGFLQLITDLEIWLPDADDPLGILGDIMQIRRPLDRNRETNEPVD